MSLLQAVRLLDLKKVLEVNAPGDPRLWDVLNDSLGGITVQLMHLIGLEWDKVPDRVPGLEDWNDWLALEGSLGISLATNSDAFCLQKRRKFPRGHPLEQLIYDWMKVQGYPLPKRLWFADHYVITGTGAARSFESMRGLMALGSKSGIWDENIEDCRLLAVGDSFSWPYRYEIDLEDITLHKKYFMERVGAHVNLLTSRVSLTENTGRGTPGAVVMDSIVDIWRNFKRPVDEVESPMSLLGPEHLVIALPKTAQFEKIGESLKDFVQEGSALMDRHPGVIRYRESAATLMHLENFPDFCSKLLPLEIAGQANRFLYAIAPWDSLNQVMHRRIEYFHKTEVGKNIFAPALLPGSIDWVASFLKSLSTSEGWKMGELTAFELIKWNTARLSSSALMLFWSELPYEQIKALCDSHGLEAHSMGEPDRFGTFTVGEQTVPTVQISFEEIRNEFFKPNHLQASWFYKDQKSPTYGFEKAAIFPDRFLKRISEVGIKGEIQKGISWGISSSPVHRDHLMKQKINQPISYVRWSDGINHWVDAVASIDGIADHDPRALGEWCCDLALRGMVCKGVDPNSPIFAQAWFSDPNSAEQPEAAERFGAFYLANRGLKEALQSYKMHFEGLTCSGNYSRSRIFQQEMIVRTRAKVPTNTNVVFPGFRMAGEILFVLGPKPAFMDAGTRLLPHFKVVSNHVTRLNAATQLDLYATLNRFIREGVVTVARPVGQSGALGAILEMALWGNIGVSLKPGLSNMDLFSGAPGRIVVGVLPQEVKKFESAIRLELISHVGESAGDRIFGQPLSFYRTPEGVHHGF